ncbi:hypothetical protein [Streptomyces jumonjinensis]|uniref:hypothetical protein n=1 Tax=Streptomyces jumonjinensis TaxID=1945 RepID=UPI00379F0A7C
MRDSIARALMWVLNTIPWTRRAEPGRHSARYLTALPLTPAATLTENPWSRPWTGPSSAQVREIFRPEGDEETALPLSPIQRERRYAAAFAAIGVDYDYPGAPFPGRPFVGLGESA